MAKGMKRGSAESTMNETGAMLSRERDRADNAERDLEAAQKKAADFGKRLSVMDDALYEAERLARIVYAVLSNAEPTDLVAENAGTDEQKALAPNTMAVADLVQVVIEHCRKGKDL